ncbi:hypothetical protein CC78DRAFT_114198 [Lojkania enalia]|uniref:Uncharacterized protein n=1 Tax=Lojkania enalia TaxID=147567 RepID=A0A9P4JX02_9PLEO|nr:hypothetical protein CC78DRAFT_114198 [Didymosphaeria enalia]
MQEVLLHSRPVPVPINEHVIYRCQRLRRKYENQALGAHSVKILSLSAGLVSYFDRGNVQLDHEIARSFFTNSTLALSIQEWATTTESQVPSIAGVEYYPEYSLASSTAAQYASMARQSGLPIGSCFCNLPHDEPP